MSRSIQRLLYNSILLYKRTYVHTVCTVLHDLLSPTGKGQSTVRHPVLISDGHSLLITH
jgi:hypothetical protein